MTDLGASMYADLLGAALQSVDWQEIARNMLSDMGDTTAAEIIGEEDDDEDDE